MTTPKRRKPLARESAKRRAQRQARKAAGEEATRIGVCTLFRLGGCSPGVVPHELVKQSAMRNARLVEGNVIALCSVHNSWVEDNPIEAQHFGVSIPRWVFDMHGQAAFDEAARLRSLVMMRLHGEPFWLAD